MIKYAHIYLLQFVVIWLGLYFDSKAFSAKYANSQLITDLLVILTFIWIYANSSKYIKKLMLWGLLIALGGELFFSLLLGMYSYRLNNLPIYVPFGHSVIYATVFYITKEPIVQKYKSVIVKALYTLMIIYSTLWLIFANDIFGFLCMLIILALFKRRPKSKLFFLIMFFTIVYLELLGTYYGCWSWPNIWFDRFSLISSANPPSAISVFYFAFDMGCMLLYKLSNPKENKEAISEIKVY